MVIAIKDTVSSLQSLKRNRETSKSVKHQTDNIVLYRSKGSVLRGQADLGSNPSS